MYSARNDGETQYIREWNQDLDEKIFKLQEIVHSLNYQAHLVERNIKIIL